MLGLEHPPWHLFQHRARRWSVDEFWLCSLRGHRQAGKGQGMMAWTCPEVRCLPGQGRPSGSRLFHVVGTAKAKGSDGCTPLCVLSVFLSAQIRLPLCTFPCKQQFLTANISQKPEPALSLPPFFPSLSLLFMKLRVSV